MNTAPFVGMCVRKQPPEHAGVGDRSATAVEGVQAADRGTEFPPSALDRGRFRTWLDRWERDCRSLFEFGRMGKNGYVDFACPDNTRS